MISVSKSDELLQLNKQITSGVTTGGAAVTRLSSPRHNLISIVPISQMKAELLRGTMAGAVEKMRRLTDVMQASGYCVPVPCLWLVVCSTAALQHYCSLLPGTWSREASARTPASGRTGRWRGSARREGVSSGLRWLEVQLSSYLGRPGELEQVHHVLLEVLHVGHGLLGLGLLLGLLGLLWLLLILLLLKCQG